jgi:hypothetical protein
MGWIWVIIPLLLVPLFPLFTLRPQVQEAPQDIYIIIDSLEASISQPAAPVSLLDYFSLWLCSYS